MHRLALAYIVSLTLIAGLAGVAEASCIVPVVTDQIERADVIAVGRVTATTFNGSRLTFRATVVYKGILPDGTVSVQTGPSSGGGATSVDYRAPAGEEHTLYLRRSGAELATDACSGSHLGALSSQERTVLGAGVPVDGASGPLAELLDQPWATLVIATGAVVVAMLVFVLIARRRRAVAAP